MYCEEELPDKTIRVIMKFPYQLAPYEVAVLPLVNKLNAKANYIFHLLLANNIRCTIDYTGSIGKKYRRQDAIGTPFCVTIDFKINSLFPSVTIRNRDDMSQIRCSVKKLVKKIKILMKNK